MEKKFNLQDMQKVKCPHCGYSMPVFLAKGAKCSGIFVRCKGRNCKQFFEIRVK